VVLTRAAVEAPRIPKSGEARYMFTY
jgi:hypothetical protein